MMYHVHLVEAKGIVLGSGIPFLKLSNNIKINNNADKILKISLTKPFLQILSNCGIEHEYVLKEIKEN